MKFNKKNPDFKLSLALLSSFMILTFQYLILVVFNLVNTPSGSIIQTLSKLVVAFFFIYAFPSMWKRVGTTFIIIYIIAISIFCLHYLFYIPNRLHMDELVFPIFFMCIPALIYTLALRDLKVIYNLSKKIAIFVFICGFIISLLIFSGTSTLEKYSMSLSYYMLLPALIFINEFLNKYRLFSFGVFLASVIIILSLGSRGALLCIAAFILLKLIRPEINSSRKSLIFKCICFFFILITILNYKNLLTWLNVQFSKYGISSRTINLLAEGEIHLSGRDNIANAVIDGIYTNPLLGLGIGGDRVLVDTYSHNIIIEVISSFGIILGSIIIIGLLALILKCLINVEKVTYDLLILWISLGFVNLMVSGSYLTEIKFWIFLGIIINLNSKFKKKEPLSYE